MKQQSARLERAAGKTPLVISAATGAGVPEVLRALVKVIDGSALSDDRQSERGGAGSRGQSLAAG